MAVYVDPLLPCVPNDKWKWRSSCHLFADTMEELHQFARRLRLKPEWFQDNPRLPHYDLTIGKRLRALRLGAIPLDLRQIRQRKLRRIAQNNVLTKMYGKGENKDA